MDLSSLIFYCEKSMILHFDDANQTNVVLICLQSSWIDVKDYLWHHELLMMHDAFQVGFDVLDS
jgi:hypothetical protein